MSRRERTVTSLCALALALVSGTLGLARYATFHNRTFDLAFYSRIAWGLARGDVREPIVGAHVAGLHLSPILVPLGLLGRALGATPVVLLVAQSVAVGLAVFPLARLGKRLLGTHGALAASLAWIAQPNLGHVAAYEFHPGTCAVLPLAWLVERLEARDGRGVLLATLGVLACREDLALVTILAALLALRERSMRKPAVIALALASAWLGLFVFALHPWFAPREGSLEAHFGPWGQGIGGVASYLLSHPGEVVAHLLALKRLLYLPKILVPLLFLPLLSPRLALPALPILLINLLSHFPTTTWFDSHYLTPALPFLIAAQLEGARRLAQRWPKQLDRWRLGALVAAPVLIAHGLVGGTPLSLDFERGAFLPDARAHDASVVLAALPPGASIQAPDALLPHVAERRTLHRGPPPERQTEYVVLDLAHRARFAQREDLLRTTEEPRTRWWLARPDHGVVAAAGTLVLLRRSADPRQYLSTHGLLGRESAARGTALCGCLSIVDARLDADVLSLRLLAHAPCPDDLAVRLGTVERPARVDLLLGGYVSPAHFRAGDLLESLHPLSADEARAMRESGLRVGVLRESGARPEPSDPMTVSVPVR